MRELTPDKDTSASAGEDQEMKEWIEEGNSTFSFDVSFHPTLPAYLAF